MPSRTFAHNLRKYKCHGLPFDKLLVGLTTQYDSVEWLEHQDDILSDICPHYLAASLKKHIFPINVSADYTIKHGWIGKFKDTFDVSNGLVGNVVEPPLHDPCRSGWLALGQ